MPSGRGGAKRGTMTPDAADRDPLPPPRPSLAGQIVARVRRPAAPRGPAAPRWLAIVLALVLAAGPIATIAAAHWLETGVRAAARRLDARVAPGQAAQQARSEARRILAAALVRPGPAQLLDQLAAALPAEANVVRAERKADGMLEVEVATSDPDALRSALRRAAGLSGLHDIGQQEGGGRTLVLLRGAGS